MAISYTDKATSRGVRPDSDNLREITLGMTQSMAAGLDFLAEEMNAPVEELLSQAVGLLLVTVEAQGRGQRICITDDELNIVREIVDFGIESERTGDDRSPEDRPDHLDS